MVRAASPDSSTAITSAPPEDHDEHHDLTPDRRRELSSSRRPGFPAHRWEPYPFFTRQRQVLGAQSATPYIAGSRKGGCPEPGSCGVGVSLRHRVGEPDLVPASLAQGTGSSARTSQHRHGPAGQHNPWEGSVVFSTGTRCPRSRGQQPQVTHPLRDEVGGWDPRARSARRHGMAARGDDSEGFPSRSRRHGQTPVGSLQPAVERVHVRQEVVEPLLRRADLLSQLLRIGYARGPQGQEM